MKKSLIELIVMKQGLMEILLSIIFLLATLPYLGNPLFLYLIPVIFMLLFVIITGLFEFREHYNKILYSMVITGLLVVMWIVNYIQFSPSINVMIYYPESGVITLILIGVLLYTLRTWEKNEKTIKYYDNLLAINPNDITSLNNKCVELASQRKYWKATECFDKALEVDPEDAATLYNKSILLKKARKYHKSKEYHDKALELDPGLEKAKKEGKLLLEIEGRRIRKL